MLKTQKGPRRGRKIETKTKINIKKRRYYWIGKRYSSVIVIESFFFNDSMAKRE